MYAACSHFLATVCTLLDRSLPHPLDGTMSTTQWRLKRSHDINYRSTHAHATGSKHKVIIAYGVALLSCRIISRVCVLFSC